MSAAVRCLERAQLKIENTAYCVFDRVNFIDLALCKVNIPEKTKERSRNGIKGDHVDPETKGDKRWRSG